MALVKPAERSSTAVHRRWECLNGNSAEIRPQALSCEAVRRGDPSSYCSTLPLRPQGTTSHFPIDGLVSGIKSQRIDAPSKVVLADRLRTYMDLGYYITRPIPIPRGGFLRSRFLHHGVMSWRTNSHVRLI